jgi:hypothetical protein
MQRIADVWTQHTRMSCFLVSSHVFHHVIKSAETMGTNHAKIFIIWRSLYGGLLEKFANQQVSIDGGLSVELLVAHLADVAVFGPILLQAGVELIVMDHHMTANLELTHEGLSTDIAEMIFLNELLWFLQIFVDSFDVTID